MSKHDQVALDAATQIIDLFSSPGQWRDTWHLKHKVQCLLIDLLERNATQPAAAESVAAWVALTAAGQLRKGDKIRFRFGQETLTETVALVLDAGTEREEIVYNRKRNFYFITSKALAGTSSAKEVEVLRTMSAPPAAATAAAGEPVAYIPAATMARLKPGMAVPATLFAPPIPEEHYGVPVFLAPPAATPVAAGEPVAWADNIALGRIASGRSVVTLSNVETVEYSIPLFRVAPPAAAPLAADDPVAWMIDWPDEPELGHYFSESPDKQPGGRSRPLFTAAPPAAAHGDEAVQYRLLRVGEVIKATDELLMDDCTTWHPMGDGPQIGIGWGWHAGLMPVRRIDAAMRAQGDGEPS